jgi:hypothetical protein
MGGRLSGHARSCRAIEGQRPRMQAPLEMEDLLHSFGSSASSLPAKVTSRSDPLGCVHTSTIPNSSGRVRARRTLRAHTLRDKQRLLASSPTSPRVPDPLFLPKSRRATALRHPQQRPASHHTAVPKSHEEAAARRAARDPFVARTKSTTTSLTARWRGSPLSL